MSSMSWDIKLQPMLDCEAKTIEIEAISHNGCGPFQYRVCIGYFRPDIGIKRKLVSVSKRICIPLEDIKFAVEVTFDVIDACGKKIVNRARIANLMNNVVVENEGVPIGNGTDNSGGPWIPNTASSWSANGSISAFRSSLLHSFIPPLQVPDVKLFVCQKFQFFENNPLYDGLNVTYIKNNNPEAVATADPSYTVPDLGSGNPLNGEPGYTGNQFIFKPAKYDIGQINKDTPFEIRINGGWNNDGLLAPAPNAEINAMLLWTALSSA